MNSKENEVVELDAEELKKKETPEEAEDYIIEQVISQASETTIDWRQKLSSRKLWAAVLAAVMMCVSALFGENMDTEIMEIMQTAAYALIAYVFGESVVDAAREVGRGKANAARELSEAWMYDGKEDGDDSVRK